MFNYLQKLKVGRVVIGKHLSELFSADAQQLLGLLLKTGGPEVACGGVCQPDVEDQAPVEGRPFDVALLATVRAVVQFDDLYESVTFSIHVCVRSIPNYWLSK